MIFLPLFIVVVSICIFWSSYFSMLLLVISCRYIYQIVESSWARCMFWPFLFFFFFSPQKSLTSHSAQRKFLVNTAWVNCEHRCKDHGPPVSSQTSDLKTGHPFVDYLREWPESCLEMCHTIPKDMEPAVLDIRLSSGGYGMRQSVHFSGPQLSYL